MLYLMLMALTGYIAHRYGGTTGLLFVWAGYLLGFLGGAGYTVQRMWPLIRATIDFGRSLPPKPPEPGAK